MLTLDPTLVTALANQTGVPVVTLKSYNMQTGALDIELPVSKFNSSRLSASVWIPEGNTATAAAYINAIAGGRYCIITRGLTIQGITYSVDSPRWFTNKITYDGINIRADFLAWNSANYYKSTDASQSAADVIADLISDHCTASFLAQDWNTYQFDKSGATLTLRTFEGLLPMIWNRYTVKMFPRQGGVIYFKSKILDSEDTAVNLAYLQNNYTPTLYKTTHNDDPQAVGYYLPYANQRWNIFSQDETGATHRLSATYAALASLPLRNATFLPSTADAAYVKRLLSDNQINIAASPSAVYTTFTFTVPVNFAVEQGDYANLLSNQGSLVSIEESFNMGGTVYPWQMKIKAEEMFYGIR